MPGGQRGCEHQENEEMWSRGMRGAKEREHHRAALSLSGEATEKGLFRHKSRNKSLFWEAEEKNGEVDGASVERKKEV